MSDIQESAELSRARLEEKMFEFKLSMKRMARRRCELQYELDKITENEVGTEKTIADMEANLKKLGA